MYNFQNNFVKCLGIIYLIRNTQLCKLWLWHMSRFSTRFCGGSPSGSLSGSRGVQSPSSCTELGPIRCWPDCSASRSQPTQANGVQLFLFSRDLGLMGSNIAANRQPRQAGSGHHSTGPWARGKHPHCGFPLTNIKDLAFSFGHFCYPLFVCHFVVV